MRGARWLLGAALLGAGCGLIPSEQTECSATRPCPAGQACDTDTSTCHPAADTPDPETPECTSDCVPCTMHSDCMASQVCDVYVTTKGMGTCVAQSSLVYVDNRNGTCVPGPMRDGESVMTALCDLTDGVRRVDGARKRAVRVMASTKDYGPLVIPEQFRAGALVIYGPARQVGFALIGNATDRDAVVVSGKTQVVLDGLDIFRGRTGVVCSGDGDARVSLRRSRVTECADLGVLATDCALTMDRVLVQGNDNGAVAVGGSSVYAITNSFFVRNSSSVGPAFKVASSGSGTFRFNTVADNMTTLAAGIDCGGHALEITDSIVVRNHRVDSSQFQGGCRVRNTVVGQSDAAPGIKQNPDFTRAGDIDYGLSTMPDNANKTCCFDKALGSLPTDYFGVRRPRGMGADIGAHEAR